MRYYICMLEFSIYHKVLRISSLTLACVLAFQSGLFNQSTALLAAHTQFYVANVISISATVAPTELNQVTAHLTQKSTELAAREAAVQQREIAVGLNDASATQGRSTFILEMILFILLVLIVLNYALDYIRNRKIVPLSYESKAQAGT